MDRMLLSCGVVDWCIGVVASTTREHGLTWTVSLEVKCDNYNSMRFDRAVCLILPLNLALGLRKLINYTTNFDTYLSINQKVFIKIR